MIKKLWLGALFLAVMAGCVEDSIRRLQTDQSFEGEEAYLISKLLDEHLFLLWQPMSFYKDSTKLAGIPDCPLVTLDTATNQVTLDYEGVTCPDMSSVRSGKLLLSYTPLPIFQGYSLTVIYDKYSFQGNSYSGSRILKITAQNRDKRVFSDSASNVLITAQNQSSSRVNINIAHELMISGDSIIQGHSTGTGNARNWVGRDVNWEITEPKFIQLDCLDQPLVRPSSGQETWTVSRSSTSNVIHRLTFHREPDCTTHTIIQLDEGVEMKKAP
ncbi:hypothetical protein [Lunatibacter salilacus]|uniref:hypothetical protein n=1 Tax=Lunatibacter salilacus TaxID=2483804 RepID=UPI00131CB4EE|nr:hypothetical protein [Lunatibacter salilacus]